MLQTCFCSGSAGKIFHVFHTKSLALQARCVYVGGWGRDVKCFRVICNSYTIKVSAQITNKLK